MKINKAKTATLITIGILLIWAILFEVVFTQKRIYVDFFNKGYIRLSLSFFNAINIFSIFWMIFVLLKITKNQKTIKLYCLVVAYLSSGFIYLNWNSKIEVYILLALSIILTFNYFWKKNIKTGFYFIFMSCLAIIFFVGLWPISPIQKIPVENLNRVAYNIDNTKEEIIIVNDLEIITKTLNRFIRTEESFFVSEKEYGYAKWSKGWKVVNQELYLKHFPISLLTIEQNCNTISSIDTYEEFIDEIQKDGTRTIHIQENIRILQQNLIENKAYIRVSNKEGKNNSQFKGRRTSTKSYPSLSGKDIRIKSCNNIIIEKLIFDRTKLKLNNCRDITIKNCEFDSDFATAIRINHKSRNIKIKNCSFKGTEIADTTIYSSKYLSRKPDKINNQPKFDFSWDFSSNTITYDYRRHTEQRVGRNRTGRHSRSTIDFTSKVEVNKNDKYANVLFRNIQYLNNKVNKGNFVKESTEEDIEHFIHKNLSNKGQFKQNISYYGNNLLFKLPMHPLAIGETTKDSISIPIKVENILVNYIGYCESKLVSIYFDEKGDKIAKIFMETDLRDVKCHDIFDGSVNLYWHEEKVIYFNMTHNYISNLNAKSGFNTNYSIDNYRKSYSYKSTNSIALSLSNNGKSK